MPEINQIEKTFSDWQLDTTVAVRLTMNDEARVEWGTARGFIHAFNPKGCNSSCTWGQSEGWPCGVS